MRMPTADERKELGKRIAEDDTVTSQDLLRQLVWNNMVRYGEDIIDTARGIKRELKDMLNESS